MTSVRFDSWLIYTALVLVSACVGEDPQQVSQSPDPSSADDAGSGNGNGGSDAGARPDGAISNTPEDAGRGDSGIDAGDDAGVVDCTGLADGAVCGVGWHCAAETCVADACGDGVRSGGEECDDGNSVDSDACTNACRAAKCGDGIELSSEECDDGNAVATDACTNACKDATCGDGIKSDQEQCDDGNAMSKDGCDASCRSEAIGSVCGNGVAQPGEECDDGNSVNTDACTNGCKIATCGDGIKSSTEGCDDGNTVAGDSCSASCQVEVSGVVCGNQLVESGEQCDDGNTVDTDACTSACQHARCGDAIKSTSEECDDGNAASHDGCSASCKDECVQCQNDNCTNFADEYNLVDLCFNAQGTAAAGPAAGQAKRDLCLALVDCVHRTECADTTTDACYCGTVAFATCTQTGGNGQCKAEFEAAAETTVADTLTQRTSDLSFAIGPGFNLIECEKASDCLSLCE